MKRLFLICCLAVFVCWPLASVHSAVIDVVSGGDFSSGLSAWKINNIDKHPAGIKSVDIDGSGPLKASDAFYVQTGGGFDSKDVSISQHLDIIPGESYTLHADLASSYFPTGSVFNAKNFSGGVVTVLLGGKKIASYDFKEIIANNWLYATLDATFSAASAGLLEINFFRPWAVGDSPFTYLDNLSIVANSRSGQPVSEPATILIMGAGLIGLAAFGRGRFLLN